MPVLKSIGLREVSSIQEVVEDMRRHFHLTEYQMKLRVPNKTKTVVYDKVTWAMTHLAKSGLIEKRGQGFRSITKKGGKLLSKNPSSLTYKDLNRMREEVMSKSSSKTKTVTDISLDANSKKPAPLKNFPKSEKFYWPCLEFVSSKGDSGARLEEIKRHLIERFNLSPEQQKELVRSGYTSKLYNRANWALSHLKRLSFISKHYETGAFYIQPKGQSFYQNENEKSLIDHIRELQKASSRRKPKQEPVKKDSKLSDPDFLCLSDLHKEIQEEVDGRLERRGVRYGHIFLDVWNRLESYIKDKIKQSGHDFDNL